MALVQVATAGIMGTKFIVVAYGLLNIISAVDAHNLRIGRKPSALRVLSHFSAVLLFATFASVVFGITQRTHAEGDGSVWSLLLGYACRNRDRCQLGDVVHPSLA